MRSVLKIIRKFACRKRARVIAACAQHCSLIGTNNYAVQCIVCSLLMTAFLVLTNLNGTCRSTAHYHNATCISTLTETTIYVSIVNRVLGQTCSKTVFCSLSFCSSWSALSNAFSFSSFIACIFFLIASIVLTAILADASGKRLRGRVGWFGCWTHAMTANCRASSSTWTGLSETSRLHMHKASHGCGQPWRMGRKREKRRREAVWKALQGALVAFTVYSRHRAAEALWCWPALYVRWYLCAAELVPVYNNTYSMPSRSTISA